jgi:hypothetical protein
MIKKGYLSMNSANNHDKSIFVSLNHIVIKGILLFLFFGNAFLQASIIEISNPSEYSLKFGPITPTYYYEKGIQKRLGSEFKPETQIPITEAQWNLIGLQKTLQENLESPPWTDLTIEKDAFNINAFKVIVLPTMDKYNKFLQNFKSDDDSDKYRQTVQFYNKSKEYFNFDNYQEQKKALECALYLQLPEEIKKILFNLCYDAAQEYQKGLLPDKSDTEAMLKSKLLASEEVKFFLGQHNKLLISVDDIPEKFVEAQFISPVQNIDFRNQALRSLSGLQKLFSTARTNHKVQMSGFLPSTRITLDFSDNWIQEISPVEFSHVRARDELIILSNNPLSEEAKKQCVELNGPLQTLNDFNQDAAKKETLIGRLRGVGYTIEGLLVLSSLYGLYRGAKKSLEPVKPWLEKMYQKGPKGTGITLLTSSMILVGAGLVGSRLFESIFHGYRFFHRHVTSPFFDLVSRIWKSSPNLFIFYDEKVPLNE